MSNFPFHRRSSFAMFKLLLPCEILGCWLKVDRWFWAAFLLVLSNFRLLFFRLPKRLLPLRNLDNTWIFGICIVPEIHSCQHTKISMDTNVSLTSKFQKICVSIHSKLIFPRFLFFYLTLKKYLTRIYFKKLYIYVQRNHTLSRGG